jgi:hypothetical protein
MLWVHFNDRKRVRQVYAKEYMIMDDRGIYAADGDPCDTTDKMVPVVRVNMIDWLAMLRYFGA